MNTNITVNNELILPFVQYVTRATSIDKINSKLSLRTRNRSHDGISSNGYRARKLV